MSNAQRGPAGARKRDAMGFGLAAIAKIASAPLIDKVGLRKQLESLVQNGTRTGFRAAGAATRQFKKMQGLDKPARLASTPSKDLFDLEPDEE